MPMDIPTIEITADDLVINAVGFNSEPSALQVGTPYQLEMPARLFPFIESNTPLYGPGSVTYEITGVTIKIGVGNPEPIAIDPKTYIDNYGIVHVGPSNMPVTNNDLRVYTITFNATYHYINPSDGTSIEIPITGLQITPVANSIETERARLTAITYQQQPGTNG